MKKDSRRVRERKWWDSSHASLCLLGGYLRRIGFFQPLEEQVHLRQKVRRYTPVQKLEMLFVSLLAGAKAVSHTGTTLRVDPALQAAFGLPGCAEQSVLADTLNAATAEEVAALRAVVETSWQTHSAIRQHDFTREILVLDLDLSPLPASRHAEGSERGYMGRCRSKTGRKLVRVRAASVNRGDLDGLTPKPAFARLFMGLRAPRDRHGPAHARARDRPRTPGT